MSAIENSLPANQADLRSCLSIPSSNRRTSLRKIGVIPSKRSGCLTANRYQLLIVSAKVEHPKKSHDSTSGWKADLERSVFAISAQRRIMAPDSKIKVLGSLISKTGIFPIGLISKNSGF